VELHGGTIGARSELGTGSEFFFELACDVAAPTPLSSAASMESPRAAAPRPIFRATHKPDVSLPAVVVGDALSVIAENRGVSGHAGASSSPSATAPEYEMPEPAQHASASVNRRHGIKAADQPSGPSILSSSTHNAPDQLVPSPSLEVSAVQPLKDDARLLTAAQLKIKVDDAQAGLLMVRNDNHNDHSAWAASPAVAESDHKADSVSSLADIALATTSGRDSHERVPSGDRRMSDVSARVLVVEDHSPTARLMQMILVKYGCQVTIADNGAIAVQHFASGGAHFNLVFMDGTMPELGK